MLTEMIVTGWTVEVKVVVLDESDGAEKPTASVSEDKGVSDTIEVTGTGTKVMVVGIAVTTAGFSSTCGAQIPARYDRAD